MRQQSPGSDLPAASAARNDEAESRRRRRRSLRHSALLLLAMAALLGYCGWIVAGWQGIVWSVVGGTMLLVMLRRIPPGVFLRALSARILPRSQAPALHQILDGLSLSAGLERPPLVHLVAERFPIAFTVGGGEETTIVLSESLLEAMTAREIRGILAHEVVHVRNGDLALMQLAVVVSRLTRVLSQLAFLLIFFSLFLRVATAAVLPIVPLLVLAVSPLAVNLLQLALSRAREAEADLEAAELTGDAHALASALVKMRRHEQILLRRWSPSAVPLRVPSLLRDHPATEERIRRLLAMPPPDRDAGENAVDRFGDVAIWRPSGPWSQGR